MSITDRLRDLAERVSQQLPHARTEEATKLALINPFIREILGYNTADLSEVVPEYTADVGLKKGEKVDYAIMRDGRPLILIEAKKASVSLQAEEPTQLYRYFTAARSARFGIYTNGVRYLFYSDLDRPNLMDDLPFLVLDLLNPDPNAIEEVAKFVKSEFDPDRIRASANTLKYTTALKRVLHSELNSPSQEFVKLLMGRVYTGLRTSARLKEFTQMTKAAANELIRAELRGTLNSALARGGERHAPENDERLPDAGIVVEERPPIRSAFRFSLADVPVGAQIHWYQDPAITCEVISDKMISFKGEETSLSAAAKKIFGIRRSAARTAVLDVPG